MKNCIYKIEKIVISYKISNFAFCPWFDEGKQTFGLPTVANFTLIGAHHSCMAESENLPLNITGSFAAVKNISLSLTDSRQMLLWVVRRLQQQLALGLGVKLLKICLHLTSGNRKNRRKPRTLKVSFTHFCSQVLAVADKPTLQNCAVVRCGQSVWMINLLLTIAHNVNLSGQRQSSLSH